MKYHTETRHINTDTIVMGNGFQRDTPESLTLTYKYKVKWIISSQKWVNLQNKAIYSAVDMGVIEITSEGL